MDFKNIIRNVSQIDTISSLSTSTMHGVISNPASAITEAPHRSQRNPAKVIIVFPPSLLQDKGLRVYMWVIT